RAARSNGGGGETSAAARRQRPQSGGSVGAIRAGRAAAAVCVGPAPRTSRLAPRASPPVTLPPLRLLSLRRSDMMVHGLLLAASLASSISVQVTGHGRPMILIPGFVSSGDVWSSVVDHYKDTFECHVVTVAGFAGVEAASPIGLQRVRDDVIAYAKA